MVDGRERDVVSPEGIPIGPTWSGRFFLGADGIGRDLMVRLLYGGRNSLIVGFSAAAITLILAALLGLLAGYSRGWVDATIRTALDVIWSFPVIVLAVALGVALALGGLRIGPVEIAPGSIAIPIVIIGVVFVPYAARPIRAQARSLRGEEFVEAARAQGAGPLRIMLSELLPNLGSTLVVLCPVLVANAILIEAALSFLGAGVRPPNPSWGGMIADGLVLMNSAPWLVIAPGLALVLTVLAVNGLAEAARRALDPGAPLRVVR